MKNNKEIGFDVLENSDINTVEEIGTENMKIDKNARDRMLKITMDKYTNNKQMLDKENKNVHETEEYSDEVTNVETYNRSKIRQFVYIAACSAAAVALIAGSVFAIGHNKNKKIDVQEPLAEKTITTYEICETVTSTAGEMTTTAVIPTTAVETSIETVTSSFATETTTIATETSETAQSDEFIYHNPHPDRTDITDEEIDAARIRALDKLMNFGPESLSGYDDENEDNPLWEIKYALEDINGDSIPELFIGYHYLDSDNRMTIATTMFIYDSNDYILAYHRNHSYLERETITGSNFKICPEENLICTYSYEEFPLANFIKIEKDNTTKTLYEFNERGCFKNGKTITPDNYNSDVAFKEYETLYNEHNWEDIFYEFTTYADKNEAAIKLEQENQ